MLENDNEEEDKTHTPTGHEEPIRKCPYCGEEKKSRGLFAHVLNSRGNGHGAYRQVSVGFEATDAEIIGFENINTKGTITNSESGNELILCEICGNRGKGMHGYRIHIKKMAGKKNHPEDPTDITEDQFRAIPADEYWNPISASIERERNDGYKETVDWENENNNKNSDEITEGMFVPVDEMRKLQDTLIQSREKQVVLDELERIIQRYS